MPDTREQLAQRQAALVRAVASGGAAPAGFDAEGVAMVARSLRNKRLRTAARAWPALEQALGEAEFRRLFFEYARQYSLPPSAMPGDDAMQFVRWLQKSGQLPDAVRRLLPSRWRRLVHFLRRLV